MTKVHHKTVAKIAKYATNCFYRLNAPYDRYYGFNTFINEHTQIDWNGGYCDSIDDKYYDHFINLKTRKLIK